MDSSTHRAGGSSRLLRAAHLPHHGQQWHGAAPRSGDQLCTPPALRLGPSVHNEAGDQHPSLGQDRRLSPGRGPTACLASSPALPGWGMEKAALDDVPLRSAYQQVNLWARFPFAVILGWLHPRTTFVGFTMAQCNLISVQVELVLYESSSNSWVLYHEKPGKFAQLESVSYEAWFLCTCTPLGCATAPGWKLQHLHQHPPKRCSRLQGRGSLGSCSSRRKSSTTGAEVGWWCGC